jgi:hypothetical protein
MLCSEFVWILQPGETKKLWPENCVGKLRWYVHNLLGAWDSPLECWSVASTITKKWKPAKRTYSSYLPEINDGKSVNRQTKQTRGRPLTHWRGWRCSQRSNKHTTFQLFDSSMWWQRAGRFTHILQKEPCVSQAACQALAYTYESIHACHETTM